MDILTTTTTDSNPPRHAIESDSEDEYNPLHASEKHSEQPKLEIKFLGDQVEPRNTLIVATGDPGAFWARGADLGEQTGAVAASGVQIGMIFNPKWTKANVIISEALSRLPVWAMNQYAQAIIDTLKPTTYARFKRHTRIIADKVCSIALLDEYSAPSYISKKPIPFPDAPIRYLSTTTFDPGNAAEPFAPPNLITNTSASFLSILSLPSGDIKKSGAVFLLPSPNIAKPAPRTVEPSNFTHLTQDVTEWPLRIMLIAHKLLLRVIGESDEAQEWKFPGGQAGVPTSSKSTAAARRSEIGEGGMYI
ncbi:hypothetical protein AN958_02003 [Leucoagaricus sp. SymC.cos]|nr:hypothetical protein AN958_02003 [Leucoagaricus sp. SymC.cos]